MSEQDEIGAELDRALRVTLMAAAQAGEQAARRTAERQREAATRDREDALAMRRELDAERDAARLSYRPATEQRWWRGAEASDVARAWEAAAAWQEHDPQAAAAMDFLREGVQRKWGVEVDALLADSGPGPAGVRDGLAGLLDAAVVDAAVDAAAEQQRQLEEARAGHRVLVEDLFGATGRHIGDGTFSVNDEAAAALQDVLDRRLGTERGIGLDQTGLDQVGPDRADMAAMLGEVDVTINGVPWRLGRASTEAMQAGLDDLLAEERRAVAAGRVAVADDQVAAGDDLEAARRERADALSEQRTADRLEEVGRAQEEMSGAGAGADERAEAAARRQNAAVDDVQAGQHEAAASEVVEPEYARARPEELDGVPEPAAQARLAAAQSFPMSTVEALRTGARARPRPAQTPAAGRVLDREPER